MTCFNRMNPETGRRLTRRIGPHLFGHFTSMRAQIRMDNQSFGANGSSQVPSNSGLLCQVFVTEGDVRTHRTPKTLRAKSVKGSKARTKSRRRPSTCAKAMADTLSLEERKWRRGELNPCPRRHPRKHLHVYPAINSEEPSHAPAHCRLPSVHEIDSQTGAVAPPICQPAVHVFAASRRHCENVAVN
jgi:hypothetical protein